MTPKMKLALLAAGPAAAAMLLAGCGKMGGGDKPAVDAAAIETALKAGEVQWNADYKARDVARLVGHYAPDAALMAPDTPFMNGIEAIKAGLTEMVADPALDLKFAADKVDVSQAGDWAYTRGHFTMTATDPKTRKPFTQTGSYLTLYGKQPDGSWKAVEDIATPTQAAAPPAAAAK